MKSLLPALALASAFIAGDAAAQATTYTFLGQPYDTVKNSNRCTVGECAIYSKAMRPRISLTFSAPLPANLMPGDHRWRVIGFSVDDGIRSGSSYTRTAALQTVNVATNGAGVPVEYDIQVQRLPGPPYLDGKPGGPDSRFSYVYATDFAMQALTNGACMRWAGNASQPQYCAEGIGDEGVSSASVAGSPTVTRAAAIASIPTLSEWALIVFGMILTGSAAVYVQRQRTE